jgi:hypothetical protein
MRRQTHNADHAEVTPRPTRRLIGTGTGLIALLIVAPLVLSACSGNSGNSPSAYTMNGGGAQQPRAQAQNGGTANGSADGAANNTAVKLPSRSLIITAGLQVKTDDAAAAAQKAQIVVEGVGGYVSGESIGPGPQTMPSTGPSAVPNGSTGNGSASNGGADVPSPATLPDVTGSQTATQALLVLRVPPQTVDSVLSSLAGKGTVTYQSRTATDVTSQVADVASRVTSAQAAIAELRALIDKASSMNDLISLEQALAQRESDLESLEAQQKALTDQVQYATITVGYFSQGAPAPPPPPVRTGFIRGLTVGWHGFLTAMRGVLAAVGWLIPYAVVVAVLWWPVRRLVRLIRRSRARRGPQQTPAAPSEN